MKKILLALALGSCALHAQTTLRTLAAERGRYVGSILNSEWFSGSVMEGYEGLHQGQFNLVVAENEMKFDALHPAKDTYDWTKADKLMAYAEANNMRVRGHALAWHSQVPAWVANGTWTRETLLAVLKDHISTVVGHYKGRIAEWDVVNEAITDDAVRGWRGISSGTSVWASTIGPDFIDSAFVWAHAADPDAELYYNDYAIEWGLAKGSKAAFLLEACKKWKESGIPITGVGTQTHIAVSHTQTPAHVKALADSLKALGLKLQITELDIGFPQGTTPTQAQLEAQGHLYGQFMDLFLEQDNMDDFVMWGFTDRYSWLPKYQSKDLGLIFDKSLLPKPAYDSLVASLQRHAPEKSLLVPASPSRPAATGGSYDLLGRSSPYKPF